MKFMVIDGDGDYPLEMFTQMWRPLTHIYKSIMFLKPIWIFHTDVSVYPGVQSQAVGYKVMPCTHGKLMQMWKIHRFPTEMIASLGRVDIHMVNPINYPLYSHGWSKPSPKGQVCAWVYHITPNKNHILQLLDGWETLSGSNRLPMEQ